MVDKIIITIETFFSFARILNAVAIIAGTKKKRMEPRVNWLII